MDGLRRKPVPLGTDDELARAWRARRHHHRVTSGASAMPASIPVLPAGTIVATGHACSILGGGHVPSADELATAMAAFEESRCGRR
jgi:hypothetical protein